MVRFLIMDFSQNICDDDYYIIRLLCRNYTSLHCSMLSTYIKATVPSISYFNWQKSSCFFVRLIGNLPLRAGELVLPIIWCSYHTASRHLLLQPNEWGHTHAHTHTHTHTLTIHTGSILRKQALAGACLLQIYEEMAIPSVLVFIVISTSY